MTATEELRRLLDERGVEWRGGLPTETMVEADGLDLLYVALPDGRVRAFIRNYLTPEQAVEATLGRGRLTAEQVHELIAPHLHARPTFDFGHHGAVWSADFQAIADELNATLGQGTCHMAHSTEYAECKLDEFECSECGWRGVIDDMLAEVKYPRFCPNCGAKVVE